jgi:hypothetical protein
VYHASVGRQQLGEDVPTVMTTCLNRTNVRMMFSIIER